MENERITVTDSGAEMMLADIKAGVEELKRRILDLHERNQELREERDRLLRALEAVRR